MTYRGDGPPPVSPGLFLYNTQDPEIALKYEESAEGGPSKAVLARSAVAVLLVGLVVIGGRGHWLVARAATRSARFSAFGLPIFGVMFKVFCAVLVLAVIIELIVFRRLRAYVSSWLAGVTCAIVCLLILMTGLLAAAVPTGWLPTSSRRALVTLHIGFGAWLAMAAALALAFWSWSPSATNSLARVTTRVRQGDPSTVMGCAALLAFAISAWSRYQPWLRTADGTARGNIPGWGIPVAGSFGLISVLTFALSLVMWIRFNHAVWLLVMACAGWLLSLSAAITVIVGSVLQNITVSAWLPSADAGYSPRLSVSWGAWLAFGAGCASAAIAAALLARQPRKTWNVR